MKTDRLNCPSCGKPYPLSKLVRQIGWRMLCPACGTRLAFSQQSALQMGAIAGLTFGAIIVLVGGHKFLTWPTLAWSMLFAFVYGRILCLFLGTLAIAPNKISFDPFPNQHGGWKILSVSSLVAMVVLGLSGFFWKYLPLWGVLTVSVLMVSTGLCLLVSTAHNLFGRSGCHLKGKGKSEQTGARDDVPAAHDP